eukprot:m.160879 g.160879  ORF g.160879 m.160879 type:complete len:89 (+) comp38790_c0_seq8:725-991(+)
MDSWEHCAVSRRIVSDWKFIGRRLRVSDHDVRTIEANYRHDSKEQAYQVLKCWQQREGQDATVQVLIDVLVSEGLRGVANVVFGSEEH